MWSSALFLRQHTPRTADSEAFRIFRISFTPAEVDDIRHPARAGHYYCGNAGSSPTALTRAGAAGEEPVICVRRRWFNGQLGRNTGPGRRELRRTPTRSAATGERPQQMHARTCQKRVEELAKPTKCWIQRGSSNRSTSLRWMPASVAFTSNILGMSGPRRKGRTYRRRGSPSRPVPKRTAGESALPSIRFPRDVRLPGSHSRERTIGGPDTTNCTSSHGSGPGAELLTITRFEPTAATKPSARTGRRAVSFQLRS